VASPLWSVSVEEQFYVAWPLLIFCFGVGRIRRLAFVMLAVACATRILLAASGAAQQAVWCNTFARLDPIACGALLAVFLRGGSPALGGAARAALAVGGLAVWLLVTAYLKQDGPTSLVTYPAAAAGSLMLLVAALRADAPLLRRAPLSLLVYLGRISYGLYVFHLFALAVMSQQSALPLVSVPLNFERRLACSFLLTVVLAAASYRWLERPFLRLKGRFTYVPSGAAPLASARPSPAEVGVVVAEGGGAAAWRPAPEGPPVPPR
jgi:peptidoglycan/LPS O-acetylase OafA/YrhL